MLARFYLVWQQINDRLAVNLVEFIIKFNLAALCHGTLDKRMILAEDSFERRNQTRRTPGIN
jgi:hypothetical protein